MIILIKSIPEHLKYDQMWNHEYQSWLFIAMDLCIQRVLVGSSNNALMENIHINDVVKSVCQKSYTLCTLYWFIIPLLKFDYVKVML